MSSRWVVALMLVLLAGGIALLREVTMTRYEATPPTSTTRVTFEVERNGGFGDLPMAARALLTPCVLDVTARLAGPIERVGDRFSAVLQPALDDDERTKFTGCLGDWRVPHTLAVDIELTHQGLDDDEDEEDA